MELHENHTQIDRIRGLTGLGRKKERSKKTYTQLGIVLSGTDTRLGYLSITPS
jgi:hypothetical protein